MTGIYSPFVVVRSNWLTKKPDPWANLIAMAMILLLTLLSVIYWRDWHGLSQVMPASFQTVFTKHQYWRLWSTLFVHADEKHLLSNSFMFYILGYFIAGYFGVLIFPIVSILFGGVINLFVLLHLPPTTELVGISGVVFWMGGFWLTLYFLLETRKTIYQRTLRSIGVAILLFAPAETFIPNVSYLSHFLGFGLGTVFAGFYYLLKRTEFQAAEEKSVLSF